MNENDYQATILLVEDEHDIAELVSAQLKRLSYKVIHIDNGNDAIEFIQNDEKFGSSKVDLFLLDRMLPGHNGVEICKFIRFYNKTKNHPILFLTALDEVQQVIEGLEAGADDYVPKPFNPNILGARVKALLRRSQLHKTNQTQGKVFSHMNVTVDTDQCIAKINDIEVPLTKSEYRLLVTFITEPGKVFTRDQLVGLIQDGPIHVTSRTIDTHIFGLRKKLEPQSELIETVRGIGYRIKL